ncbi:enoyl-CoA hydratase [Desulfacinum hydrothermale DSM 13146]|uniref:3-hydroxyisobutyryl-CoA hydrolase n=1 Tax=Desulfacinum hydrothermale DSM 13146 TaxID=1121390 RepID=A0A1W1XAY5_9BACT|nr:enoyl-CoA hydratase/isomerase family protein [Desulfacinum hydrothermale]SMC21205.1 enoyl-CoA hydratase [Desulfacinum hydrothermale DSM 13146]
MHLLHQEHEKDVLIKTWGSLMEIRLNRPQALNSLTTEMVQLLDAAFQRAGEDPRISMVLLTGSGSKGFCAGGDIKQLAQAVGEGQLEKAEEFFQKEYALDLSIHRFPKPVIVLAHGVTMGGGLGLAAGADAVLATSTTHMAMPETRIGFFPDVGSTGWLFHKCPPGYPEYLALTGYDLTGKECVRVGLATHYVPRLSMEELRDLLQRTASHSDSGSWRKALEEISEPVEPGDPHVDAWVRTYFAGKADMLEIMKDLSACSIHSELCQGVFQRLSERSPTAVVLTLRLLRLNQGRPLDQVFEIERKAAGWIIRQPDYLEGVRARLLDKDDNPRWQPPTLEEVGSLEHLDFLEASP